MDLHGGCPISLGWGDSRKGPVMMVKLSPYPAVETEKKNQTAFFVNFTYYIYKMHCMFQMSLYFHDTA